LKKYLWDYVLLSLIAGIVIGLDQWTKELIRIKLDFTEIWSPWSWLTPYARIVHWKNTGAAFGMLQNYGDIFSILAILVAIAILYYFPQVPRQDWILRFAMGLQLGGALGNLVDRITQGYVTDFISVATFPVFNIADASISVGVAILILGMWYKDRKEKRSASITQARQTLSGEISPHHQYPGEHIGE
jgi:signal peptidase II